ncbi:MAG: carboxypeptidase regulatory-like domain-containing protein [Chitinophagaceae bacterium]|nr:MAG: carboxypeptidase regulatory-like domain-containing protein [Chitinophagaceae bacterium]
MANLNATGKGMGSFYLMPTKGDTYYAVYNLNGKELRSALPMAKDEGTTLRIDHLSKPDSLYIYIKASESKRIDQQYELVAQSGVGIELKASISLKNGFSNLKLPKSDFSDGIIHFTLFSPDQKPINERSVLINHKQHINLQISTDKRSYGIRDSIALEIVATTESGKPLRGSFAVSITDDKQVKQETYENTITSYFLLESNLKGNIEEPGWYFSNAEASTLLALDNLLLAQAWVGYNWDEILSPLALPKFKAEKDNKIFGRLNGLLNTPVPNVKLTLLSLGKNVFLTDTISNIDGRFVFNHLPIIDSPTYSIKIKKPSGKTSGAIITIDEFKAATHNLATLKPIKPWYVNADSTFMNYYQTGLKRLEQGERYNQKLKGNILKEVEIKGVRSEVISKLVWDAVLMEEFTEVQLKKVPRKSLFDLLKERIPALRVGRTFADDCHQRPKYHDKIDSLLVGSRLVRGIRFDKIEGSLIYGNRLFVDSDWSFKAYMHLLTYFNAEDAKHIEVYKGCEGVYIDITTRSGNGPWMGRATGVYVYRPLPIYKSKDFYSPKYAVDSHSAPTDYRATIFWDANVVTDENGKAKLSFYAADLPTSYTIKVEGTDLLGRFGYKKSRIMIKNKTESR